jgi:Tfp pilus assembly protein PilO
MLKLINKLYLVMFVMIAMDISDKYEQTTKKKNDIIENIKSNKRKIKKLTKQKEQISVYLSNIDKKKQEIEEVALQVEKVQKKLPTIVSDTENISLIKEASSSLKMKKIAIRPTKSINNGFYITKNYSFKGKGTYLQFLLFLEKLASSERILNVSNIDLKRAKNSSRSMRYDVVDFSASIESYKYNEKHKEDRGIEDIENKLKKILYSIPAGPKIIPSAP